MKTTTEVDSNNDMELLELAAEKKPRSLERLIFREKHGADVCCVCNKQLGPTDPLDYVCLEHSTGNNNIRY